MPMPTPVRPFTDAAASRAPRPAWGLAASVLLHAGALATILWGTTAPEIVAGIEAATVYDVLMAEAPPGPEAPAEQAVAEPTAEPVVEPVAEPPVTEATPEPVVEPLAEPLPEPIPEPTPKPTVVAELPPEPAPEPIPEPPPAPPTPTPTLPPPTPTPTPTPPKPAIKRESAAKPPRLIAAASAHPPSAAANVSSGGGAAESAQAVSYAAEPTRQPPPKYPAAAQRRGLEGKVMLRVRVSPAGAVEGVELLSGSGAEILDEAAIQAVRGWTFRPAMRLGVAVAAVVDVPVRFRLDEQR
jgi:periplasmic protein TonB